MKTWYRINGGPDLYPYTQVGLGSMRELAMACAADYANYKEVEFPLNISLYLDLDDPPVARFTVLSKEVLRLNMGDIV